MLHVAAPDLDLHLPGSANDDAKEWTDMPGDGLRSEVEWLAGQLSASLVRYERELATRLQQFLEISPDLRRDFARTHFSNSDLNWFQGGVNAAEAVASEEYLGERINLGADYRRAHDIIDGILSYARAGG